MFVELFMNLGFLGFYTIYALLVGSIAVLGLYSGFKKRLAADIIFSWLFGFFLVSSWPIASIVVAVFIRLLATGIKRSFRIENVVERIKKEEELDVKIIRKSTRLLEVTVVLLVALLVISAVFTPPLEVIWYGMKDVKPIVLESSEGATLSDITWEDVKGARLVSQEFALQIPKTMVTETGWRLSEDWDGIYPINKKLYWVMCYEPDKLVNYGNPSPAYILVNAQDPADRQKIQETIEYSEERGGLVPLIYQLFTGKIRDVKTLYWLKYPFFEYGDTVFTHDDQGNPVWFAPVKIDLPTWFIVKFYNKQLGIITLNNEGKVTYYTNEQIANGEAPEWLTDHQVLIDEDYSELRVYKWAKYASWKGFLNYYFQHEQVYEIAQDFYFQYDKDRDLTYGLIQLEPEGRERKAITYYVEIKADGNDFGNVNIYDTRVMGLVGPVRALDAAKGEISLYADWIAYQPLFKRIGDGYFYVIPVYSGYGESMVIKAVAVVDARTEQVKLFKWGEVEVEAEEGEEVLEDTIPIPKNCDVISTSMVEGKLRFIIECD